MHSGAQNGTWRSLPLRRKSLGDIRLKYIAGMNEFYRACNHCFKFCAGDVWLQAADGGSAFVAFATLYAVMDFRSESSSLFTHLPRL